MGYFCLRPWFWLPWHFLKALCWFLKKLFINHYLYSLLSQNPNWHQFCFRVNLNCVLVLVWRLTLRQNRFWIQCSILKIMHIPGFAEYRNDKLLSVSLFWYQAIGTSWFIDSLICMKISDHHLIHCYFPCLFR